MSAPDQAQPSVIEPRQPPAGRKFPCPSCGARLDFDPAIRGMQCPYCGHKEAIEHTVEGVTERDWDEYWSKQTSDEKAIPGRSTQVRCTGCGAVVLLQDQVATDKCPYCATHLENKPESAQDMVQPGALVPFAVNERQAITAFQGWIKNRWFAPSTLYQLANLGKMSGAYVPFWTFDAMTYTHYTGERGVDYTVTETYTASESYTETDADGNEVTRSRPVEKTRQVTKTNWFPVAGNVDHFFDDVLIYASQSMPESQMAKLLPWELAQLEDFKAQFLSGFLTERYSVNLTEGFEKARAVMEADIRNLCCRHIGGDHQRLNKVVTQHVGVTFKHILLPVWLAAYRYQNQPYRILVNGQTGKVTGTRPYSWIKITLAVLAVVAAIALPILLVALLSR